MFYKAKLQDHIRVPPSTFNLTLDNSIIQEIRKKYEGYIDKDLGIVIDVAQIEKVGDGIIIPGDGAPYYDTTFELMTFKPELQEVVVGKIKDVAEFGAFISMGPIEGMIHVSQTMDDFVSMTKDKVFAGKDSKKTIKMGDNCRARIIAVSYKDINNPKIGLTMRQPKLGRLDWMKEAPAAEAAAPEKEKGKKK